MQRALLLLVVVAFIPRAAAAQGEPLGPEFRVNTFTASHQNTPSVAADTSGNFVVVWQSGDLGSGYDVFGQRYASTGAPLGSEFRVNTYTTGSQYVPAVASDSSGNFVVVWSSYSQDGSHFGVFGQRYATSGEPLGLEFRVNTYTTSRQDYPGVASDSSGNFVVVWRTYLLAHFGVFGQRFASTGEPLGPEFLVNTFTMESHLPAVASDSSGNFVVVWQGDQNIPGGNLNVFGQRYDSTGAPLGPEFRVNTYTMGFQVGAAVASDSAGNLVVVWSSTNQDGSGYGVFGRRYSGGTPLGPPFRVNTYTSGSQANSAVALAPSGNFVVVWNSSFQDGSGYGVFGQRYANTGEPLGPEFRVNTYTSLSQAIPSVASDSAGNFVVVWNSRNQDGSGYDVFGQRYSPIVPVELMQFSVE